MAKIDRLFRKEIEDIPVYIPGKPIEEVERMLGLKGVIKVGSNENPLGPSPKAVLAIKKALKGINRYPDAASWYLKAKLSTTLKTEIDKIICGNGSDDIIILTLKAFAGKGDEVIVAKPTFLIYQVAAGIVGADVKFVPLTKALKYDLRAMKRAITDKTKIIFIANPDNPAGTYVTKRELEEFFDGLPEDLIVYLDEAYYDLARDVCEDYPNGLDYLDRPNLIVARSFSKVYGLAGLRIGYGVTSARIVRYLDKYRDPFNVNILAQVAACAALDDKEFVKKTLRTVREGRQFLCDALDKMGLEYVKTVTNFMMINVRRNSEKVFEQLICKGVIVRDMKAWGYDSFIRVSVGTREENKIFIETLKKVLSK
ncbi:MAG: histidinol-phosphate transaminase [Candidatus Omnitrophota bacterium]|jgi:histidinol-phosphate aminotransferase|nr:histidinol-phosphate transaminase [Candidatus Omnitrophota bacterium]